jgi:phosphatidylglycerophosphatase A
MNNTLLKFFATGGFVSYVPAAILKGKKNTGAGFLGTLEGVLLYLFFMPQNKWAYAAVLLAVIAFSSYAADRVCLDGGKKDDPRIVIDEVAGYLLAVAFLPQTLFTAFWAFVLFRIFDSSKIGFIKKTENFGLSWGEETKRKFCVNGFAVVLDDLAAGLCSNLLLQALLLFKLF